MILELIKEFSLKINKELEEKEQNSIWKINKQLEEYKDNNKIDKNKEKN